LARRDGKVGIAWIPRADEGGQPADPVLGRVALVAEEQLVAAVARQRHPHLLGGDLADVPGRQHRRVGERLVVAGGDRGQQVLRLGEIELPRGVTRAERGGDDLGVRALVVARIGETDREGAHRPIRHARHRRDHRRAVDAARQERADLDVGDHLRGNGVEPGRAEAMDPLGVRGRLGRRDIARRPIGLDARLAGRPDAQQVAGRQHADLAMDRAGPADMAEAEEVEQRPLVGREGEAGQGRQRLQLRPEGEAPRLVGEEQRLDADRVARQRQPAFRPVPDRDREHAVEPRPDAVAPALVAGEDDLRVTLAGEGAVGRAFGPERAEIVDFAVEDQAVAPIGRMERLMATLDIDDRQAPHAHAEVAVDDDPPVVGSAMDERRALVRDDAFERRRLSPARVKPCNAADFRSPAAPLPPRGAALSRSSRTVTRWLAGA